MKFLISWKLIFVTTLVLIFPLRKDFALPPDSAIEKGKVLDTVWCRNQPDQSYALYLPSYFKADQRWPVIFIFDPGARGALPVDSFRVAAEKYGFILAGSNNSENGTMERSLDAAGYMFNDVITRFSIDSSRIYTAGFSGGSRSAFAMAMHKPVIAGVIGCGAGMPALTAYQPISHVEFIYYGLVGLKDMNYQEMFDLEKHLDDLGIISCLQVFDTGHDWPASPLLEEAVAWLQLQAMHRNKMPEDHSFIHQYFEKLSARADSLTKERELFEAVRLYHYLQRDFPDQTGAPAFSEKLANLEHSKDYKINLTRWNKTRRNELDDRELYLLAFDRITVTGTLPDSVLVWWKNEVRFLERKSAAKDPGTRLAAIRLLNMIHATCSEWGWSNMEMQHYVVASQFYKLWSAIEPQNKYAWYYLSRSYACIGEKSLSVKALKAAIKNGLKKKQTLVQDPVFNNMREEKAFIELLDKLE
ncbi:MAG: hypothetical protein NTX61_01695 [Bacteroidetes bacterium]|nr:hypothetical protein [Bacteroidota bacterium]